MWGFVSVPREWPQMQVLCRLCFSSITNDAYAIPSTQRWVSGLSKLRKATIIGVSTCISIHFVIADVRWIV